MRCLLTALLAMALAGCQAEPPAPTTADAAAPAPTAAAEPVAEAELSAEQELARFCRVCVVNNGEKVPEYLPSRLDTVREGHTYRFCNDRCKAEFDAAPERYTL